MDAGSIQHLRIHRIEERAMRDHIHVIGDGQREDISPSAACRYHLCGGRHGCRRRFDNLGLFGEVRFRKREYVLGSAFDGRERDVGTGHGALFVFHIESIALLGTAKRRILLEETVRRRARHHCGRRTTRYIALLQEAVRVPFEFRRDEGLAQFWSEGFPHVCDRFGNGWRYFDRIFVSFRIICRHSERTDAVGCFDSHDTIELFNECC
mmetsp:Transcript_24774/g.59743  ORF Transcript_24774/g.59743 Transcript_24774/m.59743 type:complete len:209 (-) Transcript_24774:146-772(-)